MISLWYYGVHKPSIGRRDLVEHFKSKGLEGDDAQYAAQIKAVDESVGRVRQALKAKGMDQNTIIMFTAVYTLIAVVGVSIIVKFVKAGPSGQPETEAEGGE